MQRPSAADAPDIHRIVDAVYRAESRRVFATLIRLLGDFDIAEEALHDAFRAALEQWPREGVPANPRAWLVRPAASRPSTACAGALASTRSRILPNAPSASPTRARRRTTRRYRGRPAAPDLHLLPSRAVAGCAGGADAARGLRPHAPRRSRTHSLPQRRPWRSASCAQRRRSARPAFPIRCRRRKSCRERLDSVLRVIYLVFNEGYSASSGESLTRHDLSGEAIRLGAPAGRTAARARGDGPARADAAARIAPRRAHLGRR